MDYQVQTGRVNPLALRDAALDYVLGKQTRETIPMWEFYGAPRNLFMPLDHPKLLTQIYGETDYARKFFYQLLIAMETLHRTCREFYPRDGWEKFQELRKEMLAESQCMLYFQVIAWLSVDGREKVEELLPQMRGLNLHYGLVALYPEPILHTASCFTCFERPLYEQALPPERLEEIDKQAADLVKDHAMSADEPCPDFSEPYEYEEPEELDPVRIPVTNKSIEIQIKIPDLVERAKRQQAQRQLLTAAQQLLWLSCPLPLRQKLLEILEYLEQVIHNWGEQPRS
jgi:hypothetical protein